MAEPDPRALRVFNRLYPDHCFACGLPNEACYHQQPEYKAALARVKPMLRRDYLTLVSVDRAFYVDALAKVDKAKLPPPPKRWQAKALAKYLAKCGTVWDRIRTNTSSL